MRTKTTLFVYKHLFLLSVCFTQYSFSQSSFQGNSILPITLNYDNYIVPPAADYFMQGADPSGVSVPAQGNEQVWDYSTLTRNDAYNFSASYERADNVAFKNARRQNDFVFILGGIIALQETGYESNDNNFYRRIGRSLELQKFPLQMLTGNSTDSLIINQQNQFDSGNFAFVSYPCSASSTWSNDVRGVTTFLLSVAVFGYENAPGEFVQRQTLTRTVVGSGKMRIPAGAGKTAYIDVLMIKSVLTTSDSVYINGEPAPDALLAAFGLTQGEQSTESSFVFLREGIDESLITFNMNSDFSSVKSIQFDTKYTDIYCGEREKICINGWAQCVPYRVVTPILLNCNLTTIGYCETHFATKNSFTESNTSAAFESLKVFPNPSHDQFTLYFNNREAETIIIRVVDVAGKVLLQSKTKLQQITFGNPLKPGIYFTELIRQNTKQTIKLVKL